MNFELCKSFPREAKKGLAAKLVVTTTVAALLTGCVTTNKGGGTASTADSDPCSSSNNRMIGAAVGALAVGAAAYFLGGRKAAPAVLGAAGGGAIGYLIGQDMDDRRCEQWKIAQAAKVPVRFDDVVAPAAPNQSKQDDARIGQIMTWEGQSHFLPGSATLTPEAQRYFRAAAETYTKAPGSGNPNMSQQDRQQLIMAQRERRILLIGHTDDTGNSESNAALSEARARNVGEIFRSAGIDPRTLYFQGAGEKYPIADNRTEEGRSKNRRVEVVEMDNEEALATYLRNRFPNAEYYRPSPAPQIAVATEVLAPPSTQPAVSTRSGEMSDTGKADERSAAATAPATRPTTSRTPSRRANEIDLGGVPADQVAGVSSQMIGGQRRSTAQSLANAIGISSAQASDSIIHASCLNDRPRIGGEVKRMSDGKAFEYKTTEYMPGLYKVAYGAMVNGHMVGMTDVAVLRDGATPVGKSPILVFKNYAPSGRDRKPDVQLATNVNVYPGNDALLYRAFVEQPGSSIRCVDVVFPYQQPFVAKYGKVYYEKSEKTFAADFTPTLAR